MNAKRYAPVAASALAAMLLLAACGGGAPPPASNGEPAAPTGQAPAPTAAGEGQRPPAGGVVDGCAVLSAEEVAAALGVAGVTASDLGSDDEQGNCEYLLGNRVVAYLSYSPSTEPAVLQSIFSSWMTEEGAERISGIGDEAIFVNNGVLVRKGSSMANIVVNASGLDTDQFDDEDALRAHMRTAATELAALLAARM